MIIHYLDWQREPPSWLSLFLAAELAAVVPRRENAHIAHWLSRMMFTGLFQSDAQIYPGCLGRISLSTRYNLDDRYIGDNPLNF